MSQKRKAEKLSETPRTSRSNPQILPVASNQSTHLDAPPKPFLYDGDLADLKPESLWAAFAELDQAQQYLDLWTIFTYPHSETASAVFTGWWEARKPTNSELYDWGWGCSDKRKAVRKSGVGKILQAIVTFRILGEEAQKRGLTLLKRPLAIKEMDYLVLMYLQNHDHLWRIPGPAAEVRLQTLITSLGLEDPILQSSTPNVSGRLDTTLPPNMIPGDADSEANSSVSCFLNRGFGKLPKVVGYQEARGALRTAMLLPITFTHLLNQHDFGWNGILLFGPPGTGKTLLAQSMAQQYGWNFYQVSAADLLSRFVGGTEKTILALFSEALRNPPSIILIDEADSLLREGTADEADSTRRCKNEILEQWNRLNTESRVLLLGVTNRPWEIDPAFRRRFQKRIHVGLPDLQTLEEMLLLQLETLRHCINKGQVQELAQLCKGYTGSDVAQAFRTLLTELLGEVLEATSFRKTTKSGDPNEYYEPCGSNVAGSLSKTHDDFAEKSVIVPRTIKYDDLAMALQQTRPACDEKLVDRHLKWALDNKS